VLDNVIISDSGRPVDLAQVTTVLDRVGIGDVVRRLPHGLDTVLGVEVDEGGDLSGGQWQRLALARTLYRDRDLVVLDEPSAALDPRAEHERLADVIHVLHEGRVVEHGSHDELMAVGGRYAELYALQADAYRT
jgi:ATP-binding cassette subfamily B protein